MDNMIFIICTEFSKENQNTFKIGTTIYHKSVLQSYENFVPHKKAPLKNHNRPKDEVSKLFE